MNDNWASILMSKTLGKTPATASLALTVFWAAGTGAHLLFTSINLWIRELQMPCPLFPGRGSIYRIQKVCYAS